MPILNEVLATTLVLVRYTSLTSNRQHSFRFYLQCALARIAPNNAFSLVGVDDPMTGGTGDILLKKVVDQILERINTSHIPTGALRIDGVEASASAPGANSFLGFDGADYSGNYGSGQGISASQLTFTFKADNKSQFRFQIADTSDPKPQRLQLIPAGDTDTGSLQWWLLRSGIPFVTRKGLPLSIAGTQNTGVNRALARSYGRFQVP